MTNHETFIRHAIELASSAREHGNHPFGALLVLDGQVLLRAENTIVSGDNPTHHAELNLVSSAWASLAPDQIRSATLYTSTEPCPMCTGAIFWSGIRRVVFSFPAAELAEMTQDSFCGPCQPLFDRADHKTEVIGPVLPEEGRRVHEGFW